MIYHAQHNPSLVDWSCRANCLATPFPSFDIPRFFFRCDWRSTGCSAFTWPSRWAQKSDLRRSCRSEARHAGSNLARWDLMSELISVYRMPYVMVITPKIIDEKLDLFYYKMTSTDFVCVLHKFLYALCIYFMTKYSFATSTLVVLYFSRSNKLFAHWFHPFCLHGHTIVMLYFLRLL